MAHPAIRFTFVPTSNAIKAVATPNNPIVILSNSVSFSTPIPQKLHDKRFEDFVSYLAAYPLRYALVDLDDLFLPQHACEFYYTFTYYDTEKIIYSIVYGEHIILMIVTAVRRALCLPIQDEYFARPTNEECRLVLKKLEYEFTKQGN